MTDKKIIIFGSTGMLGSALLIEALEMDRIKKILLINRTSIGFEHNKITEIIHSNFFDLSSVVDLFKGYDACCFCLGTSSVGKKEENYKRITYDLTRSVAETFKLANTNGTFLYISGAGTDSSEQGRIMWARVKGKTENMLIDYFGESYMFRPGYIQPMKGVVSSTNWYRWIYLVLGKLYPLFKKLAPNSMITSLDLSIAMLNAIDRGYRRKILEATDIIELSQDK